MDKVQEKATFLLIFEQRKSKLGTAKNEIEVKIKKYEDPDLLFLFLYIN